MKKSLIAGAGVAAFGLAALPMAGVFAVDPATSNSFTDELTVTLDESCTIENSATGTPAGSDGAYANRSFTDSVSAGQTVELNGVPAGGGSQQGATLTVKCNSPSTDPSLWQVKATATAQNGTVGKLSNSTATDSSVAYIDSGYQTSGTTSSWAVKSNATNVADASNPFKNYTGVPTTANTLFLSGEASSATTNHATFNPSYHIYAQPGQAAGTYKGSVTYTVTVAP